MQNYETPTKRRLQNVLSECDEGGVREEFRMLRSNIIGDGGSVLSVVSKTGSVDTDPADLDQRVIRQSIFAMKKPLSIVLK